MALTYSETRILESAYTRINDELSALRALLVKLSTLNTGYYVMSEDDIEGAAHTMISMRETVLSIQSTFKNISNLRAAIAMYVQKIYAD